MAADPLQSLAADLAHLLAAGTTQAPPAARLRDHASNLKRLGAKAPALAALGALAGRAAEAPPSGSAAAVLDLLVGVRQVLPRRAGVGAPGELEPAPPSGPWRTGETLAALDDFVQVCRRKGERRAARFDRAMERPTFADLRILDPLLTVLAGPAGDLTDRVTSRAVPAFGPGLVPELRAGFNPKGNRTDARRLQAICVLDPQAGAELCRIALASGSTAVRREALLLLAEHGRPGEAEPLALQLASAKNPELRAAALEALGSSTSQAAFDVLVAALDGGTYRNQYLVETSLRKLPGPEADARFVRAIRETAAELPPTPQGPDGRFEYSRQARPEGSAARAGRLLYVLQCRHRPGGTERPPVPDEVAGLLRELAGHPNLRLRASALEALDNVRLVTPDLVPVLVAALETRWEGLRVPAVKLLSRFAPEALGPALPALREVAAEPEASAQARSPAIKMLAALRGPQAAVCHAVLRQMAREDPNPWLRGEAALEVAGVLLEAKTPATEAVPELLDMLRAVARPTHTFRQLHEILKALDPSGEFAVPGLVEMIAHPSPNVRGEAVLALGAFGSLAVPTIPLLHRLLGDPEDRVRIAARSALERIEAGDSAGPPA